MFNNKSQIKVIVIGNDGVSRKFWVDHDAEFYNNRYKIDQDAIYQSEEKSWGMSKIVPTIMFRANSVIAVSFKTKPTIPEPDEMGLSIGRAAWALCELMRKKEDAFKTLITLLLVAACILGGAATFFGYDNGQKLKDLQGKTADLLNRSVSDPSNNVVNPVIPVIPTLPVNPTPLPTPTPAPTSQIVVV